MPALADATSNHTNLGLGCEWVQNASTLAITGSSIDGITLDGGF